MWLIIIFLKNFCMLILLLGDSKGFVAPVFNSTAYHWHFMGSVTRNLGEDWIELDYRVHTIPVFLIKQTLNTSSRVGTWPLQRFIPLIPPLHRGCDLSASIVRPQNWPGRRWRQKGGRTVALVAQWCYTGRSDIAMDAMVAVKFWACSKQSHKGRRGGRSLTGRSKEAGGRHTCPWLQNECTVVGHWSPRKKYVLLWTLCINLSNASAFLVPPLCLL